MTDSTWTPPVRTLSSVIPPEVGSWIADGACPVLATIQPNGQPHVTVVWAAVRQRALLMATVANRRKHLNLVRDPRATILVTPLGEPDHYVEMRGTVEIQLDGGRQLIDDLHEHYRGTRPYPWDAAGDQRLLLRFVPDVISTFCG